MRTRTLSTSILGALVLVASLGVARADDALLEQPRARQGYYLGAGQHLTLAKISEDGDDLGTFVGHETTIRLGQLLTERLGLGLVIDFGGGKNAPQNATLFALGLSGQFEVARDLAVHAGLGVGVITLDDTTDDSEALRGVYAGAFTVGVSYDWFPWKRLSGGWAVSPSAWLRAIPSPEADAVVGLVGVEILYWSGRPKNQLDLPPDQAFRE
jgi:hypothetical protein